MPKSDDIVNLFHQFGGKADDYQEISRTNTSRQARSRWPLLSALDPEGAAAQVPPVQPSESAGSPPPVAFRPAPVQPVAPLADLAPVVEPPGITPPLGTPVESAVDEIRKPVPPVWRARSAGAAAIPPQTAATPVPAPAAAAAWTRQEPAFAPVSAPVAAPAREPAPVTAPAPTAAPVSPWAAAPSPVAAGGSPLARLGAAAAASAAPAPAQASPAAPSGNLQEVFARLAGQPAAPAVAPIAALWRRLGGGA